MTRPLRRLSLASAVALALACAPAWAKANDYEAGVAARVDGRPADAKSLLLAWLVEHPDDLDAQLQLAYAELALGHFDAARRGFEAVLVRAPGYADARSGLDQVKAARAAGDRRVSASVEAALSELSGGAGDWREVAFDIEVPVGTTQSLGAKVASYRRFAFDDVELTGRAAFHPADDVWLRLHAGGTPHADFRPKIDLGGGIDWRLSRENATVFTLDAAWQRFPLQDVVMVNPGVVQYLAGGRGWLTLRGIGTIADGGRLEVGALARGDFVPADGWRVFAGAANAPDTDLGVVTRVTSLFGGLESPLGDDIGLIGSVGRDWRKGGFDRTEFRLGLKARF